MDKIACMQWLNLKGQGGLLRSLKQIPLKLHQLSISSYEFDEAYWSPTTSPKYGINHGQEECLGPSHNRKSVIAKVKERAKKLKHTLSGRKNVQGNELFGDKTSPTFDDDDDDDDESIDDPEYLGAPMYESEAAPEILKENARQHPRAVPVVSENHRTPNKPKPLETNIPPNVSPNMSEKIAPTAAYDAMSNADATYKTASKISRLTIAPKNETGDDATGITVPLSSPDYVHKKLREKVGNPKQYGPACSSPQTWDKGVSVKEYFINKMEPGEDDRALSQAITEAISPRRIPSNTSVVEKVKEVVTSFFWTEEQPSISTAKPTSSSFSAVPQSMKSPTTNSQSSQLLCTSPLIPLSSNANHEVPLLRKQIMEEYSKPTEDLQIHDKRTGSHPLWSLLNRNIVLYFCFSFLPLSQQTRPH
ncbi:hypothetical protein OROGR_019738 [Orobanche gracilis]